jgi:hypothetical protein
MTVASMGGCHSLQRHETNLTSGQSVSAAAEAPSFHTTGRAFRARSQPVSQTRGRGSIDESEEIGKQ